MALKTKEYEEIHRNLDEYIRCGSFDEKDIICFGNNDSTREAILYLKSNKYVVNNVIDNGAIQEQTIEGISVILPKEYNFTKNTVCLIGSKYFFEMREQLVELGCKENQILQTIKYYAFYNPSLSIDSFKENVKMLKKGKKEYLKIRKIYKKKYVDLYISPAVSIGDIYLILYYLGDYIRNRKADYCFILPGKAAARLCEACGENNYIIIEHMRELVRYIQFMGEAATRAYILNERVCYTNITPAAIGVGRYVHFGMWFQNVLGTENSQYKQGSSLLLMTDDSKDNINDVQILKNKTVLLAPYSNFLRPIPMDFWEELVDQLSEQGYVVYTNGVSEKEPAVKGTMTVSLDFSMTMEFVNRSGYFIGARSGLCDILSGTKAKMYIIYAEQMESPHLLAQDYYSLRNMGLNKEAFEYTFHENTKKELIQQILKDMA